MMSGALETMVVVVGQERLKKIEARGGCIYIWVKLYSFP